jgi:succinate-acetate transporter protein
VVLAALLQDLGSVVGTLALFQQETDPTANPEPIGILRFFLAAILILTIYGGAWLFTYWISKDD